MHQTNSTWSNQLTFILAAIGSAVGLGNIWRFPYMMGKNGGALFLLIYLFFILLICLVPLIAEISFGKFTGKRSVEAYRSISNKWSIFGWLGVITSIMIASFYFVLGGWVLNYIAVTSDIGTIANFESYFNDFVTSKQPIAYALGFTYLAGYAVSMGLNRGIEKVNNIIIPIFAVMVVALAIYSVNLPNAELGLNFMFDIDVSKINSKMLLDAFGQALFSLSVGTTCLLVFGSYMNKQDDVASSAFTIALCDTFFAVVSGIVIFPAVFSFGQSPESGAKLAFVTLPTIFKQMSHPEIMSWSFFALLFFAAITSAVSILEVSISVFEQNFKLSRKVATALIMGILTITVSSASFSSDFFNLLDFTSSNILMPINTLAACFVVGWILKIPRDFVFKNKILQYWYRFTLRFITPVAITAILIYGLI